jgi:hypothetical protein
VIACVLLPPQTEAVKLLPALADFSPAVEPDGAGFLLDLGDLANRRPAELLDQLNLAVLETTALRPRLGLATGRFPAQIAAASLGEGRGLVIVPGCEADFLRPLPIGLLPLDDELSRQFRLLGLRTLGQLADLPAGAVLNRFGRRGRWLRQLARGQDNRPVRRLHTPPVEQVRHTPDSPLNNRLALEGLLRKMLDQVAVRLWGAHRLAGAVEIDLTLADGSRRQETVALRQPTQAVESFWLALQLRLERFDLSAGVSDISLTLTDLTSAGGQQPALFGSPPANPPAAHLPALLARFGPERFYTVELTAPEAHLPEQRFRLDEVEP